METVFRIKVSELNNDFIKTLKKLFHRDRELEISVHPTTSTRLNVKESKAEYFTRLEKAAKDVEKGKVIRFNAEEFEAFSNKLLRE